MAEIVIMGAGLSGAIMAYEMKDQMRPEDRLTVVTKDPIYHFVPSNPWVPVGWRTKEDVRSISRPIMAKRDIAFKPMPGRQASPEGQPLELEDGSIVPYDYLIIATGPELAFDEIEGLGPDGFTNLGLPCRPREKAAVSFEEFCKNPGPIVIGAVQGASCFGPAYEFTFILETELRRRKIRDQGADDLRHLRTLHRPSRPRRRRRHQGHARKRDAREAHQMDHHRARSRRSKRQDDASRKSTTTARSRRRGNCRSASA